MVAAHLMLGVLGGLLFAIWVYFVHDATVWRAALAYVGASSAIFLTTTGLALACAATHRSESDRNGTAYRGRPQAPAGAVDADEAGAHQPSAVRTRP